MHKLVVPIFIFFVVAMLMVMGCKKKEEYQLTRTQLEMVIKEINLIDLVVQNKGIQAKDSIKRIYLERVAQNMGIGVDDMQHDIQLLSGDYKLLDSMYEQIILSDTIAAH